MGYINSENHFINIIKKVVRENPEINRDELLEAEAYLDLIYKPKLANRFTWELKFNDPCLLENERLLEWLQDVKCIGTVDIPSNLEHLLTAEFCNELKNLVGVPGVYSFWSKADTPLYVGVSHDLQQRALRSFDERFNKYKRQIYFKHLITQTSTDAAVLEVYFIGKFKPSLNGASKYGDALTIKINKEPKFSKRILCNRIEKVKK